MYIIPLIQNGSNRSLKRIIRKQIVGAFTLLLQILICIIVVDNVVDVDGDGVAVRHGGHVRRSEM